MMKKGLSIAALWALLIVLVFAYTDREEYTWSFSGDRLAHVLLTQEQADAREARAHAAMDAEKAEARARRERGEWGKADLYGGAPRTRDALDETLGLNLMWGRYEVSVSYDSPEPLAIRAVSALRQAFIEEGEATLLPGGEKSSFVFTLTDAAEQVAFACDLPQDAQIHGITVHKAGAGVFSLDLAAYAALAGAVLTVLLLLSFDTRSDAPQRRRDALAVVMIALFAGMPLLFRGIYDGHDLFFHINRIEGIAAGLRSGQFPVRIHASTLLGYGYAAPQFYPELFLYIPAVLRNLGVSLTASVRVFEMMIQLAAAAVCYASARGVLGSRRVSLGATALYMLCSYRYSNLYVRGALGESLAMIFFPLILYALVQVLTQDERRWPLLALGMTGVVMSHLLSTLFAALVCVLAALVCAGRLIRQPRRILACAKAAFVTLLCCAWFVAPFAQYARAGISTSVTLLASEHVLLPGGLFVGFPGQAAALAYEAEDFSYTVGVVPGLAVMLGCALLMVRLYMRREAHSREDRRCAALLALGALLVIGATQAFPWDWACSLPRPYSTFFKQIQYPWRLVGVAMPALAFAAAWGFMKEEKTRTQTLCAVAALCMVLAGYSMQTFVQDVPLLEKEDFCDTRIEQYEYTYEGTEKSALMPGDIRALGAQEYAVSGFCKRGTSLSFVLSAPQGLSSLELPLLYYPGYRAEADGVACRVSPGENNVIRLYGVPAGEQVAVRVWFEAPALWTAALGVSACGAALLGALLLGMGRRRRA